MDANKVNIQARTDDDLNISISDIAYSITPYDILFFIGANDMSQYVLKQDDNSFSIKVPASVLKTISVNNRKYTVVVDLGDGSEDFLFGGAFTLEKGLS